MNQWADIKYADPDWGPHEMRKFAGHHLKTNPVPHQDVYEFGVCCGHSMVAIQKIWECKGLVIRKMFGLDSFCGLPKETAEKLYDKDWHEGNFSAMTNFEVNSVEGAIAIISSRLNPEINCQLIPGFWDRSLTSDLIISAEMKIASYVDIDCDIYSSALLALDFMFGNKLVGAGTIIGYHDWGATPLWVGGESRAHKEMCKKHKVTADKLWEDPNNAVFIVQEI